MFPGVFSRLSRVLVEPVTRRRVGRPLVLILGLASVGVGGRVDGAPLHLTVRAGDRGRAGGNGHRGNRDGFHRQREAPMVGPDRRGDVDRNWSRSFGLAGSNDHRNHVVGALRAFAGLVGSTDQRIAAIMSGAASVVFGILAVSWPDVTVLVIAVVFGARTVLFGLSLLVNAVHPQPDTAAHSERATELVARPRRHWPGAIGAAASLVVALLLLSISAGIHASTASPSAFYRAPKTMPAGPGALLRSEAFSQAVPSDARAWLILYTTTRDQRVPAVASAIIVAPKNAPPGPRPVIAWAHGTTGYPSRCAPSLLKDPFAAGATPALSQVINNGWVMVATGLCRTGYQRTPALPHRPRRSPLRS